MSVDSAPLPSSPLGGSAPSPDGAPDGSAPPIDPRSLDLGPIDATIDPGRDTTPIDNEGTGPPTPDGPDQGSPTACGGPGVVTGHPIYGVIDPGPPGRDTSPPDDGPADNPRRGRQWLLLSLLLGAVIVIGVLVIPWLYQGSAPVAPANVTVTPAPSSGQPVTTAPRPSNPPPPPAPATNTPIESVTPTTTAPPVTSAPYPRRAVTTTAAAPPPPAPPRSPAPQVTTTHPVVTTPPTTFFAPAPVDAPGPTTSRDHAPTAKPPADTGGRTRD